MGYNFTGITIDKHFDKAPEQVVAFLGLPLTYVGETVFESVFAANEGDYFDIFFSDSGTSIYPSEPYQIQAERSVNCSVLSYIVGETSMLFFMALDINGVRTREVIEQEGERHEVIGQPLESEDGTDLMEAIIKEQEKLFGIGFYDFPITAKGYRYRLAPISAADIHKAPFYDSNSLASHPGRLSLNVIQWIKMNLLSVVGKTLFFLLSGFFMITAHWIFSIVFIGSLLYNLWYWFTTYNKFKAGDVNPGKVISINPDMVAIATNMTKSGGNFPILKIINTRLPRFEKEIGKFIPTVALYSDNPHGYPFWAEFLPVPISHGTTDIKTIQARLGAFRKEEFDRVDKFLAEVNGILPGTYKMEKTTSGWKDFPDVEVGSMRKMKGPVKNNPPQSKR